MCLKHLAVIMLLGQQEADLCRLHGIGRVLDNLFRYVHGRREYVRRWHNQVNAMRIDENQPNKEKTKKAKATSRAWLTSRIECVPLRRWLSCQSTVIRKLTIFRKGYQLAAIFFTALALYARHEMWRTWCPAIWDKRGMPVSQKSCQRLIQCKKNRCRSVIKDIPPWMAITPRFTSGNANFASWAAITISQFRIISTPPPNAPPETAAMIGLLICRREIEPNPCMFDATPSCSFELPFCWSLFHLCKDKIRWLGCSACQQYGRYIKM